MFSKNNFLTQEERTLPASLYSKIISLIKRKMEYILLVPMFAGAASLGLLIAAFITYVTDDCGRDGFWEFFWGREL